MQIPWESFLTVVGSVLSALVLSYFTLKTKTKELEVESKENASRTEAELFRLFDALCTRQQDRITQLQDHITANESEIEKLRERLGSVEEQNILLRARVKELEDENRTLQEEIDILRRDTCGA